MLHHTILLLGSTGRTGKQVMSLALSKEYTVHALVRDASKVVYDHPNLKIFEGDTRVPADLLRAGKNCSAVISCLNVSRKNDFPWAPLRTPEDFLSMTMSSLVRTCRDLPISRLVLTSAWGVGDSRPQIPAWFSWLIDNSNIAAAYLEHERQEALIRHSELDWTIVRPVGLTNGKKDRGVRVFLDDKKKPSLTISRRLVAGFLLDALNNTQYLKKTVVVSG